MKTYRNCWYFSYGYNTASIGVEEWRDLKRRVKIHDNSTGFSHKILLRLSGKAELGAAVSLSLLPGLQSLSWHKDVIFCHRPKDVLLSASFGP